MPEGAYVPRDALPDCHRCDKPELRADNYEAIRLYVEVQEQQTYAGMAGTRVGIRYEALLAAAGTLFEAGEIDDVAEAMRGARMVDAAVNEKLVEQSASQMAPRPPAS